MRFWIKSFILPIILCFLFLTIQQNTFAQYEEAWAINNFHSEIFLDSDRSIRVIETIEADFSNETHRGIARMIPFEYPDYEVELTFVSATDSQGNSWATDTYEENGYLLIEATTPDNEQINETATFIFEYKAENVFLFSDENDEFYWNVTGNDWVVPIKKSSTTIHLPLTAENYPDSSFDTICFTGYYDSTEQNCDIQKTNSTITANSDVEFLAYQGLTIGISLPKGLINEATFIEKLTKFLLDHWPIFIPILTFLILLGIWHKKGRDDYTAKTTVIPHYKPPHGLLPTETGTIIDEKLDPRDITATIIDLAVKGYIIIHEIREKKFLKDQTDYELELIKPHLPEKGFEKIIYKALFPHNVMGEKIKISSLKNSFYKQIKPIRHAVMDQLVKDGYFPHSPAKVKEAYAAIGGGIFIVSLYLIGILPLVFGLSTITTGVIIVIFSHFMPKKTQKGAETYYELKGLYEYINTAEKDRMKFQEDNNIIFEKLLPYAMSFGLIKKWTKAFDGLLSQPPDWYSSPNNWANRPFTMAYFADHLNSATSEMTNTFTSSPGSKSGGAWSGGSSFGGGGFSGGGFGGGGGRGL